MLCPTCKGVMVLLTGAKFWVHKSDKTIRCPITSIPNTQAIVNALKEAA